MDQAVISLCSMQGGHPDAMSVIPGEVTLVGTVRTYDAAVQARDSGRRGGLGLDLLSIWLDRKAWIEEAREILRSVRLDDKRDAHAAGLPHGDQR
jgi:ABC-type branched-subunit amino acid transport system ATPase component